MIVNPDLQVFTNHFKALNLINNKSNNTDVKFVIGSEDIHDVSSVDAQR